MAKYIKNIAIAIIISAAFCSASPARLDKLKSTNSKLLARQEVDSSQTPYPPAGIKPEVPFDLPTDGKLIAPDNTYLPPVGVPAESYGPPAKTYGPPEVNIKDEVEEVAATEVPQPEEVSSEQPDKVEPSPQQLDEEQPDDNEIAEDDAGTDTEAEQIEAEIERVNAEESLINPFPERIVLAKGDTQKAAKLRSAPLSPIYVVNYNGQLYRVLI